MKKNIIRFWSKVKKTEKCWEYTQFKDRDGYGKFWANNTKYRAHRFSYEIAFGSFEKKLHVLHKCDNPSCVRPDHLFLGTAKDNAIDKAKKNRIKGSKHHMSKLNEKQVNEIRRAYATGSVTQYKLADDYGVDQAHISHIILRKGWTHI